MNKIDIGGGHNPKEGFKSLDMCSGADIVCDIEKRWPMEDCSVGELHTQHTLEHVKDLIHVMNEMWRVMKWESYATIIVPHSDSAIAYGDPTHVRFMNAQSMKYFQGKYINKYKLDYGIRCAFAELVNETKVIDADIRAGETKPYFIEQRWVLCKSRKYFKANSPFNLENGEPKATVYSEMSDTMSKAYKLFSEKNKAYGNSYFESSDDLRYANLERKWARLKTFMDKKTEPDFESVEDTLMDMANYCMMEIVKRKQDR